MVVSASSLVVFSTAVFPSTIFVTYGISTANNHTPAIWPFISHTGNYPIESCFFSLGFALTAMSYIAIVLIRYLQIRNYMKVSKSRILYLLNKSAVFWGMLASIALNTTGSTQKRILNRVHLTAAVICTYSANIYFWHQTLLSMKLRGSSMSKMAAYFRLCLSILSTIIHTCIPCIYLIFTTIHTNEYSGMALAFEKGGWRLHLVGSISEWIVFFSNVLYIGSFFGEFRNILLTSNEVKFRDNG